MTTFPFNAYRGWYNAGVLAFLVLIVFPQRVTVNTVTVFFEAALQPSQLLEHVFLLGILPEGAALNETIVACDSVIRGEGGSVALKNKQNLLHVCRFNIRGSVLIRVVTHLMSLTPQ